MWLMYNFLNIWIKKLDFHIISKIYTNGNKNLYAKLNLEIQEIKLSKGYFFHIKPMVKIKKKSTKLFLNVCITNMQ